METPALAARLVLAAIEAYRLVFGALVGGACRYVPSCSAYAAEAVARRGAISGSWLALRRVVRCHPLGGHGYDPVNTDTNKGK